MLHSTGELSEEEEVLQWLITQKTEDRIELITRQMLETMVEETQYLAVYFCKLPTHKSDKHFFIMSHNLNYYPLAPPLHHIALHHQNTNQIQ